MAKNKPFQYCYFLFAILLCWPQSLVAQADPAIEKAATEIFQAVMSPFCPGRALQDCPSSAASDLKNDIRKRLLEGESSEAVMEYLFAAYGDEISAVPRMKGFGQVAWYTPWLFLIAGGAILLLWLRSKQHSGKQTAAKPQLEPEMEERIAKELQGR